jgi:hypothetical protein
MYHTVIVFLRPTPSKAKAKMKQRTEEEHIPALTDALYMSEFNFSLHLRRVQKKNVYMTYLLLSQVEEAAESEHQFKRKTNPSFYH